MARKPVDNYLHGQKRAGPPTVEDALHMPQQVAQAIPFKPPVDQCDSMFARLSWQRGDPPDKGEMEGGGTPATPLYVQEKIAAAEVVSSLQRRIGKAEGELLFGNYTGWEVSDADRFRWYEHEQGWSNQLIKGEACQVMASLAVRAKVRGRVQMIYCDPPYGIDYQATMQTRADQRTTGLSGEPGVVKCFRDTGKNGYHSYYDGIRRLALHARELLTDCGSFFLQIGEENMAELSLVLAEVFGKQNKVATIPFRKGGGAGGNLLSRKHDYLLWFAKDKEQVKFQQIYDPLRTRADALAHMTSYAAVELADGTERSLSAEEKKNPDLIPSDARLFKRRPLISSHESTTGRSEPYFANGRSWVCPPNAHWSVSHEGMDRLNQLNRLSTASDGSSLSWKWYEDEIPGNGIDCLWSRQMNATDMHYVVETAERVLERCILMTTEPGDIVFDPTCGSGVTAYVSEKWGRRWITSDASAVAVALARQRLVAGVYDWYKLESETSTDDPPDPQRGFIYKEMPHVTAATLAYGTKKPPIRLVDQPKKVPRIVRVSSPFTVESHSPHRWMAPEAGQPPVHVENYREQIIESLEIAGVRRAGGSSERVRLQNIKPLSGGILTHVADVENGGRAAVMIAPDDCTVPSDMIQKAVAEAVKIADVSYLVLAAFAFDADAKASVPEAIGRVEVLRAIANRDLQRDGVAIEPDDDAFVELGEPDVSVEPDGDEWTIEVRGYDCYSQRSGNLTHGTAKQIDCMLVDTNYDGKVFNAHRVHFPGKGNDKQLKRFHRELNKIGRVDAALWNTLLTAKTSPFETPGSGQVAVRIVTIHGEEMMAVRDVPSAS